MGVIDIIVIALAGVFLFIGLLKGFVHQLFSLGAWIISIVAAFMLTGPASNILSDFEIEIPTGDTAITFIAIFLITFIITKLIGKMLSKSMEKGALGFIDRLLGAVWGLAQALIIVSLLLLLAQWIITIPFIGTPVNEFITNDLQLGAEGFSIGRYLYEDNLILKILAYFNI